MMWDLQFRSMTTPTVSCSDRDLLGDSTMSSRKFLLKSPTRKTIYPWNKASCYRDHIQLIHRVLCVLFMSYKDKLPEWGHFQNEVLCVDEGPRFLIHVICGVQLNTLNNDDKYRRYTIKSHIFDKLWEYHVVMWRVNAGLSGRNIHMRRPRVTWPFLT